MNLYQKITDNITEQLRAGIIPWHRLYSGAASTNFVTGHRYSLLNQILLGRPGAWLTFNQIQQLGGRIRTGAKSRFVIFFSMIAKKDAAGNETDEMFPFIRYSNVFHIDDTEGITTEAAQEVGAIDGGFATADDAIMAYLAKTGVRVVPTRWGESCYRKDEDAVYIPQRDRFESEDAYYATLFHELVHSTAHAGRMDRQIAAQAALDDGASVEELTAEIGSAMLCGTFGLTLCFDNQVAYIRKWLRGLEADDMLFYRAAAAAEKAVKFFLSASED